MLDSPVPGAHDGSLERRGTFREFVTGSEDKPEKVQNGTRRDAETHHSRQDARREDIQALVWEQVEREYWSKKATEPPDYNNAPGDGPQRPGDGHVSADHVRQQVPETIYKDMLEKAYADLKRKETHDREVIETAKGEIRDEMRVKNEGMETRLHQTIGQLKQDVERLAAAAQERDAQETIDITSLVGSWDHIGHHHDSNPYVDSVEVFSFLDPEDAAGISSSSSGSDTFPIPDDGGGGGISGADPVENDDQQSTTGSNSNVERSQLWRGAAHVSGTFDFEPLYLRGSDAGQTWYLGDDPVYIIEFQEGYTVDGAAPAKTTTDHGDASSRGNPKPYLLIGHLWIETEALDKFGLKYKECAAHGYYLDPSLSSRDIQALVDFSFALREIRVFRKFGASPASLFPRPPPPTDDFGDQDTATDASADSPPAAPLKADGAWGSEIEAVKKARRSQMYVSVGALVLCALIFIKYLGLLYQ